MKIKVYALCYKQSGGDEVIMAKIFGFLRESLGTWQVGLLILAIGIMVSGLIWEQQRHPPVPPGSEQVTTSLIANVRQTTYWYTGTQQEVRAFYQQEMPKRGWHYCGNQGTPNCTNLIRLNTRPDEAIDVYRKADDQSFQGMTVEIWPVKTENGRTYVTFYETREQ